MARTKVISAKEAAALIKDGDTVLVGGFMTNGTAKSIVNEVTAKNLTVVCNDAGFENEGTGRLLHLQVSLHQQVSVLSLLTVLHRQLWKANRSSN